jgi:hypothetical protein
VTSAPSRPRWPVYGLLAEFREARELVEAVRASRSAGYTVLEAYTPLPLHELPQAFGYKNRLPWIVLAGGIIGAITGYGMQYYVHAIDYPLDIGGRPPNSWPPFIVVTFEMTILFAALAAVLGMLALNGLPQPYHPVFNVPDFQLASNDRFFLMILSRDPRFDPTATRRLLESVSSAPVRDVPH